MGLTLVTPPASEPVTLAEAKLFLKVDVTDDDTLITDLIAGARKLVEDQRARAFINQTWDYFLDAFPLSDQWYSLPITLPRGRLSSVTTVKYTTYLGATNTVSSGDYYVDTAVHRCPRIVPNVGKAWPGDLLRIANGVEVRHVIGYGATAANVPEQAKLGFKQLVSLWYNDRNALGSIPDEIGALFDSEIDAYAWA
jgi:uncharacterized phiE125 gp8 family phage protein